MKAQLLRFGTSQSPVVVVDEFTGDAEEPSRLADDLAPFSRVDANFYPGVRRIISRDDPANAYVIATCERAAPFLGGAFNIASFDLDEASFSLVTLQPHELKPRQKLPHFDSPHPDYYALLHYLRVPRGSGTAFFRHRATGIERITAGNLRTYVTAAERELQSITSQPGYLAGSNEYYEEIGRIEAVADRVIIYQGSLLHSGIIPVGMEFSDHPKMGRLTANFFLRGHRSVEPDAKSS